MITPVVASRNPLRVHRQQNSQAPGRYLWLLVYVSDPVLGCVLEKLGLIRVMTGFVGVICPGVCLG